MDKKEVYVGKLLSNSSASAWTRIVLWQRTVWLLANSVHWKLRVL